MHVKSTVKIIISSVLAVVSFLFIAYIVYVAEPSGINAKPDLAAFVYNGIPLTVIGTTSPGALVTVRIPKLILSKPVIADAGGVSWLCSMI